jgi:hypothetical protein
MFITRAEKNEMQLAIRILQAEVKGLSALISQEKPQPPQEKKRKGHVWTDASKVAASERMKKSWADRKAAKGVV